MTTHVTRRHFIKSTAALGTAGLSIPLLRPDRVLGANERLNIGAIGVGGRGAGDL